MTPRLISIWLCSSWSEVERVDRWTTDTRTGVDVDTKVDVTDFTGPVQVELDLTFSVRGSGKELCAVSGTFRLLYDMATRPLGPDQAAELAATTALTDTWPVWRAWLHGQLAVMGLPPTSLPARVPTLLRTEARRGTEYVGPVAPA